MPLRNDLRQLQRDLEALRTPSNPCPGCCRLAIVEQFADDPPPEIPLCVTCGRPVRQGELVKLIVVVLPTDWRGRVERYTA